MSEYRAVDEAIARFDALAARYDRGTPAARRTSLRIKSRSRAHLGRRLANIGMAIGALIVATIGFGLIVGPIGIGGLFVVALATMLILFLFSAWPAERAEKPVTEQTPNREIVKRLDSFLHRRRAALPAPAAREADAIADTLPLLESRLADLSPLDPLAQDARRLMGRHLPELIERYQRVPEPLRRERDGEGLTVDDRLAAGLGAAREALSDIGARLSKEDVDAFQTQGRFIESRYRDGGPTTTQ